ncbi:hypothetical protein OY671_005033 [Metschnikowia pulcherrima]|nr:hypothetical protein OY671_005033 [Metschnikowia pulcherrima]
MGWFWADKPNLSNTNTARAPAVCPVDHSKMAAAACPVKKSGGNGDEIEVLNPLNNMPMAISSERAPGQKVVLSTDRTISSIPRGTSPDQGNWEYPSPQQMLNAMLKKGKGQGIDETAVESMVDVHNFLNEGAWQQILDWEHKHTLATQVEPRLEKFTGRPHDLSPRARMYLYLGKFFPETFNTQPPFDRHDWTVLRSDGRAQGWSKVRYVIDYYAAPDDEETGMPAFMLDTRPALDSPTAAADRFERWFTPLWKRAMGDFDGLREGSS